ncbi:(2,3-dihydroxybenzoyl)adenylate synthase [Aquabacterium soli]|uniref:(2,3-dihydroxybenzoyl)adenylate synthase n=1 Tax=Aquabacterium soli TaxID=2493092 RepID=A0A3R8S6X1_9BURK|nr:AMP-binding protein [Aquabacterium soli]RRS03779.1 (2,3-dihydroxybenzoyl)adenylate synthase [Aquabacterium soli]
MLEGFVPFPDDFAARYRAQGYWRDQSLAQEFADVFERYAERTALIDGERRYTYAQLDEVSSNLALNLLELGLKPLDRVVPTLPNVAEFVVLYFALQKIGCIPIAALVTHRYAEMSQFVRLAQARCVVYPTSVREQGGEFRFAPIIDRVQAEQPCLQLRLVLGEAGPGEHSLTALIDKPANLPASKLSELRIEPTDPCIFQLSGGTTGIPKLIPRTNNDYAYNSKVAAEVAGVNGDSVLLLVLPIAHNLPLACPGIQGFLFNGATVVLHANTRPAEMFALIEKHGVTHIKVVPALLIRLINDPAIDGARLDSVLQIQSGGQRMQPEVRIRTRQLFPNAFVQENFGMSEGLLMFVRQGDDEEVLLETCGRPVCADDEVRLIDDDGREVPDGEVGELACRGPYTLRGYFGVPEYNARQFTPDGFYRSGDLMRKHPSGNYIVEGRKKDLINRGGEKISAEEVENLILMHPAVQNVACVPMPDAAMGEKMCAFAVLKRGATLDLPTLVAFLHTHEIARFKLPERLELLPDFPVSTFGKVSKKALGEQIAATLADEARTAQAA